MHNDYNERIMVICFQFTGAMYIGMVATYIMHAILNYNELRFTCLHVLIYINECHDINVNYTIN
jgi:hypothetical protein